MISWIFDLSGGGGFLPPLLYSFPIHPMFNINRITLLGNATQDPESHARSNGKELAIIGFVTVRVSHDDNGDHKSEPEYHTLVCLGQLASFAVKSVKKGAALYVEGHLHTKMWEDKNGEQMSRTEVIVDRLVLLSKKN